jgi:hypothetical protein
MRRKDATVTTRTGRWPLAAMMAFALTAAGCRSSDEGAPPGSNRQAATAPEETPETAPTQAAPLGAVEKDERAIRYFGPRPPALRWEERGQAPSEHHLWAPGYWRWNGSEHVWHNGGWYPRREGYDYRPTHWEEWRGRWHYVPGCWVARR